MLAWSGRMFSTSLKVGTTMETSGTVCVLMAGDWILWRDVQRPRAGGAAV